MYSAIVEIRVGHLESPRRKKNGWRSYFRLLAACLPCLIYQLLVQKSQSSLFKAPLLDPASPACFLKFLFHLPSPLLLFLFHPLLRYFRQFPLFHSMLVAYVQTALPELPEFFPVQFCLKPLGQHCVGLISHKQLTLNGTFFINAKFSGASGATLHSVFSY